MSLETMGSRRGAPTARTRDRRGPERRGAFTPLLALLVLAATGCSSEETAIVLSIGGDFAVGTSFDGVRLAMARDGAQIWSEEQPVSPGSRLPLMYDVLPVSKDDSIVELQVALELSESTVLEASRSVSFVRDERTPVAFCFWTDCVGSLAESCLEGSCTTMPHGDGDGGADGGADGDADDGGDGDGNVARDAEADAAPDADGDSQNRDVSTDGAGDAEEEPIEWICDDACTHARNGTCDDGGEGSSTYQCFYGHDCEDCGPRDEATCPRDCESRQCGDDACGGLCAPGCPDGQVCAPGGACVAWIDVHPEASFNVGSPPSEAGRPETDDELLHEVTLTHSYRMMSREVSQQWVAVSLGYNPATYSVCGPDCPAESISWSFMAAFCNWLSTREGFASCYECGPGNTECWLDPALESPYECDGYRLPTEAEWELAARGGTTTATYNGDLDPAALDCESPNPVLDPIAWYCGNTTEPQPRGLLEANDLGFHDMLGNVAEFTHDHYAPYEADPLVDPWGPEEGTQRSYRGGSFLLGARLVRSANRGGVPATWRTLNIGFRVAQTIF